MPLTSGSNFGPYRVIEQLGKGGMATVYKAFEAGLDRYVALKVLPAEFLHDETFSTRFRREAKVVARLEHKDIIPIYAFGIDEGLPWMAMRLIRGGALSAVMKSERLELERAVGILEAVADALGYAHGQGVVHRDLKPQNILLDEDGGVYLADFGIARMLEGSTVLTRTGLVTGTPQYMAPEQGLGEPVDHRADIYALGIVAYEVFTGRVPFDANTPLAVLMKHVRDPIPLEPIRSLPDALQRAVLKALAKDPADRWPSPGAFVSALAEGLRTPRSRLRRRPSPRPRCSPGRPCRRRVPGRRAPPLATRLPRLNPRRLAPLRGRGRPSCWRSSSASSPGPARPAPTSSCGPQEEASCPTRPWLSRRTPDSSWESRPGDCRNPFALCFRATSRVLPLPPRWRMSCPG
jgi:serine/threonine protein kinase